MSDEAVARDLIARIHAADHALDVDRFLALLTPDVSLQIGSQPAVRGLAAVRGAVGSLFAAVQGIEHALKELWIRERSLAFRGEVSYTLRRQDAMEVIQVPYVDVLHLAPDGRVEDYRIFIDLSPVTATLAKLERPRE